MRPEAARQIQERLKSAGFSSLSDYLAARPGVPYTELADELGEEVLGMNLTALHMQTAADKRQAAMDSLVRAFRQVLTQGWTLTDATQEGVDRDMVNIKAWAYWTSMLRECRPNEDVLDTIWEYINQHAKPGWVPMTIADPIIVGAFEVAWPRE